MRISKLLVGVAAIISSGLLLNHMSKKIGEELDHEEAYFLWLDDIKKPWFCSEEQYHNYQIKIDEDKLQITFENEVIVDGEYTIDENHRITPIQKDGFSPFDYFIYSSEQLIGHLIIGEDVQFKH